MSDIIVGIIAGSIVALVSFVLGLFGNMWYARYQENRQRHSDALKKHFQILETRFISPMIDILNNQTSFCGEISNKGQGRGWSPNDKLFTIDFKEGDGKIFKLHFQSKVNEIEKLIESINKHNEEFDNFLNSLRNKIQEYTNIPFGDNKTRPFLFPQFTQFMRLNLFQRTKDIILAHDFKNAQNVCINNGEYWRLINNNHEAYADLTTEKECQDCRQKLTELQYSPQLMEIVRPIDFKSKQLRKEIETIVESLDFLCLNYKELEKLLNPKKECPYCQAISHPNKGVTS